MRPLRLRPLVCLLTLAAWNAPAHAADALGCLIEPSRQVDVGSAVAGVLKRVAVERGDSVRAGQVLAELRNDVERAQVDLARSHAQAKAEFDGAQKAYDFARKKQRRTDDLVRKEFLSRQALDQAVAEAEVAQARLDQAREQMRHAARELELAHAQLGNRTLRSPISGVVAERFRNEGERVEDKPVLRIATLDPLRVEMVLPASLWGRVQRGTPATVRAELPQLPPLVGQVATIDRLIDPASNTFRARLDVPNPAGRVPAGLRCTVAFPGAAGDPARSPAPGDTPANPRRANGGPTALAPAGMAPAIATGPAADRPEVASAAERSAYAGPRYPSVHVPLSGPGAPLPSAAPAPAATPAPAAYATLRYPPRPQPVQGPGAPGAIRTELALRTSPLLQAGPAPDPSATAPAPIDTPLALTPSRSIASLAPRTVAWADPLSTTEPRPHGRSR